MAVLLQQSATQAAGFPVSDYVFVRAESADDVIARDALLDAAMAPNWRRKSSEALRRGRAPADELSFVAKDPEGRVLGTVRLWNVQAGIDAKGAPVAALLLGPLAVDTAAISTGIGAALMRRAIEKARALGHGAILLVGDAPYYGRFGFSAERTPTLMMPGPFERDRLLALELEDGALDGAAGIITPTGRRA